MYEHIPKVEQPVNLKVNLFPHQLAAIYGLEQREKNHVIESENSDSIIESNVGIYADMTGYGKSLAVVGMLCRDKSNWEAEEEYTHVYISKIYGYGRIKKYSKTYHNKINCNLIVANQSLISQWETELGYSDLKTYTISTRKKADNCDPNEYDVVICSPTMYNRFVARFRDFAWKRFIYDEPTHTRIGAMKSVTAGFNWFISATPDMLLWNQYGSHRNNFISSVFRYDMDYHDFRKLIFKNDDDFVEASYTLPEVHHVHHKCFRCMHNVLDNLISSSIIDMVSAGDIEGAVKALGGKETDNIVELVKNKKQEKLLEIRFKIDVYIRRGDQSGVERWKQEETRVLQQIQELSDRFENALNGQCTICQETFTSPVMLSCCQNIFCGKCIITWLDKKNTCPLCRATVNQSNIILIGTKKADTKPAAKKKIKKTKQDTIIDIIKQKEDGKFIIFSSHDRTFYTIRNVLSEENIPYAEVSGRVETRKKRIKAFKDGKIPVIFLNSKNNGAGINLQEATDIILYHEMDANLKTQILGRANRIGRKTDLTVHHLI